MHAHTCPLLATADLSLRASTPVSPSALTASRACALSPPTRRRSGHRGNTRSGAVTGAGLLVTEDRQLRLAPSYARPWGQQGHTPPAPGQPRSPAARADNGLLAWTDDSELETADLYAIRRSEAARFSRVSPQADELPPPPTVITRLPSQLDRTVLENAMVLVDKPILWEPEEVTKSLKWALQVDRIGYVGPLDGGATGLMLVLIGKATRLGGLMVQLGNTYTATVRLGVATDTYDAAGRPVSLGPWQHITGADIQEAASHLTGRRVQVPPPVIPVRVKGRPVHELAKRTPRDSMVPRPVTVESFDVRRTEPGSRDLAVRVAFARQGYVKSLVNELGQRLGCGAHVVSMRREAIGGFSVENAWTLEVLLPVARMVKKARKKENRKLDGRIDR